jgi:hypothetical protein
MNRSLVSRGLLWAAAFLATLLVLAAMLGVAVDTGHFRAPLLRFFTSRIGRPLKIEGPWSVQVLSFHPRLTAERVVIGNPPWVAAGTTAQIGKLSLVLELPWIGRPLEIEKLVMDAATLTLARDAAGYANWQSTNPKIQNVQGLPLVRSVSMHDAYVVASTGLPSFRIEGVGRLNGKTSTFDIDGDSLAVANHTKPYGFTFAERSSGSQLTGTGFLRRPFDFDVLDAAFDATGQDLKDLYFLTGVTLMDTGPYHVAGKIARRRTRTEFTDLAATSGQSDLHGTVSIETASGRPMLTIDVHAQLLRSVDLGLRAAGREPPGPQFLLPDTALRPDSVRRDDAVVTFHARRLELGRVPLEDIAAVLTIDHGVLAVAPLAARLFEGTLTGHAKMDATRDDPAAEVDLKFANLHLDQFKPQGTEQALAAGLLHARVLLNGHGRSLHQFASSADGTLTAALPHGAVRASLADLAGRELRGLGLILTKNTQETKVRCAVASFRANDGLLAVQSLVVDTDPTLIIGEGSINLQSEALDLALRGRPKGAHLFQLRSSVLLRGTLSHPTIEIRSRGAVAETAGAVALGVLLTPLASVLAFVDPGLTKDADCAALMVAAKTFDQPKGAAPSAR